jgi:hypothetical protein
MMLMPTSLPFHAPRKVVFLLQGLALLGGLSLAAGLILSPERAWANVLLLSNYLVGLSLGGLVLVGLHYVTNARWSVPLRRLSEALAIALPVGALGLVLVVVFHSSLYSWTLASASTEENAPPFRSFWLNRPLFLFRTVAYLAVWLTFAVAIVRTSRRQDQKADPDLTRRNTRLSAGFLVAFGLTYWLASSDWIMSLEPDWSSTIFGVYAFAGLLLSALAGVALLAVWLKRHGTLSSFLTEDHLHDLGTLLFAFSSFWMYTWFCQYLVVWYTNHPDETQYFLRRRQGAWPALVLLDLALNWGVPFLILLFRAAKRSGRILATVAIVILAGRWVDLFVMIIPSQGDALAIPGVVEAGLGLGAAGVFGLAVVRALAQAPLVPTNDPILTHKSKLAGALQEVQGPSKEREEAVTDGYSGTNGAH